MSNNAPFKEILYNEQVSLLQELEKLFEDSLHRAKSNDEIIENDGKDVKLDALFDMVRKHIIMYCDERPIKAFTFVCRLRFDTDLLSQMYSDENVIENENVLKYLVAVAYTIRELKKSTGMDNSFSRLDFPNIFYLYVKRSSKTDKILEDVSTKINNDIM